MNKEEILKIVSDYNKVKEIAENILIENYELKYNESFSKHCSVDSIEIDDEHISMEYTETYLGCNEYEHFSCPAEYLWNDNWKEEVIKKMEEEQRAKEESERRIQELFNQNVIKEEKKLYEKLKAKYENS